MGNNDNEISNMSWIMTKMKTNEDRRKEKANEWRRRKTNVNEERHMENNMSRKAWRKTEDNNGNEDRKQ